MKRVTDFEPYRKHLIDGTPLTKPQEAMLSKYRRAIALQCKGYELDLCVKILSKELGTPGQPLSESHTHRIIRDATQLYGNVAAADRAGRKYITFQFLTKLAREARKAKDFAAAIRATEAAGKIYDVFNPEGDVASEEVTLKRVIRFSSRKEVFQKSQGGGEQ